MDKKRQASIIVWNLRENNVQVRLLTPQGTPLSAAGIQQTADRANSVLTPAGQQLFFLDGTASCYGNISLLLKSDRAKVFFSREWETAMAKHGIAPHRIRPHCPQDQGTVERFIREIKAWLRANEPRDLKSLSACLDKGIFMLSFFKPRQALNGKTPAAAYFADAGKPIATGTDAILLRG